MKFFRSDKSAKQHVRTPGVPSDQQGYVFRRSRTLTGTTSVKVTAGAESRSQLKTARLQTHELHQLRRRVLRILGALLVGIALLSYVVASYVAHASIRYSQPGALPATETYQRSIGDYFAKHPLQRFGFMLNERQMAKELQVAHPELLSVDIDKTWYGNVSTFIMQFRKPILAWRAGGKQFYVDSQGVAFSYDHFGGKYVAVSDQSGISPSATDGTVASNRFINFIGKLTGALNAGGKGAVTDLIIPASTREVDVKMQGRGYPIKTHTDRDPYQQAQDTLNALKWFDEHKITPQYIDVRVASKAYFK